jgi:hypothetical protein
MNISNFNAGTTGLTPAAITTNTSGTITLSGTPTGAGTLTFTANVTDTAGAMVSQNFTLTVNAALNSPVVQVLPAFVTGTTCTITWGSVTAATTYDVQSSTSPSFATTFSSETVSNTTATVTGLTNGTTYYYRVRANSGAPANASSPWSIVTSATQDATAPVVAITSPATGAYTTFGSITVTGTATDTISGVASVTVNGITATTSNGFAQWSATVPVNSGANVLTAIVQDNAQPGGNTSIATITIHVLQDTEGRGIPDAWKAAHGLTGSAGNAMADPYGTGLCNFLAYAFNLDPTIYPNSPPISFTPANNSSNTPQYLTLSYRRLIGATQITYTVEISNDLINWSAPAGQITQIGTTPLGDGVTETVSVRIGPPFQSGGSLFGHVRVSSP